MTNKTEKKEAEKKTQKVSATYTLKAIRENVRKLEELGLLEDKEVIEAGQIIDKAVDKWIKKEFGK